MADVVRLKSWRRAIPLVLDSSPSRVVKVQQREPIFHYVNNTYTEDEVESTLIVRLKETKQAPLQVTSLLLLQFASPYDCYEMITKLSIIQA